MSIVKSDTLSYFYNKIKQVFARSVNGEKPDLETGDISITNVETANNLVGGDAVENFGEFSFRTSGGAANVTSGEATLAYIEGNTIRVGAVDETWEIETTNNLDASITDITAWRNQVSTDVTNYSFSFSNIPPNEAKTSLTNWWTPAETSLWTHNGSATNIISYGITTNVDLPSLTVEVTSLTISSTSINPYIFTTQITNSGTYEFLAMENDGEITWLFNANEVSLNTYGISINGTAVTDNKIIVTYNKGTQNNTTITINYTAPVLGTLKNAKPTQFTATGYNQFNANNSGQIIENATINNAGKIISNIGTYVCFCKASSSPDLGYVAYSADGTLSTAGQCTTLPEMDVIVDIEEKNELDLNEQHLQSRTIENDGYFVVATDTILDLCIHTRWDNEEDTTVEDYVMPSSIVIPLYAKDGTTPLDISTIGMSSIGTVADKLVFGNDIDTSGLYLKKIGVVSNTTSNMADIVTYGTEYIYDNYYIYYILKPSDQITYQISCSGIYTVNDFGTEEFYYAEGADEIPLKVETIYGENLRNKLKGDVVTISTPLDASQQISVLKNLGFTFSANNSTITGFPVPIEFYKVGDYFITDRQGSPNTLLGYGSWTYIGGRMLHSASTSNGSVNAAGGNDTFTIQKANLPTGLSGTFDIRTMTGSNIIRSKSGIVTGSTNNAGENSTAVAAAGSSAKAARVTIDLGGSGDAITHIPSYWSVYIWRRNG